MRPAVGNEIGFVRSRAGAALFLGWISLAACAVASEPVSTDGVEEALRTLEVGELSTAEVRELLQEVLSPERLASHLVATRKRLPAVFGRLFSEEWGQGEMATYLRALGRAQALELSQFEQPWAEEEVFGLLTTFLVDPDRFVAEKELRQHVLSALPELWPEKASPALRDRLLEDLHRLRRVGFDDVEAIEVAWGAVPRSSRERRIEAGEVPCGEVRAEGAIEASIFSLPSSFFSPAEAEAFLRGVEERAPGRLLLVLSDGPVRRRLVESSRSPGTFLLETHGRPYTPWVRDPLLPLATEEGWVFVERPNRQTGREADGDLGRELLQGLPAVIDQRLSHPRLVQSAVPFHNGQVLLTEEEVWIGLHTVELRALEILGLERVPVASFATVEGIDRYLSAAEEAAEELTTLYRRPVRWVHDLPRSGAPEQRFRKMRAIGGGAGFDLDSLLTILPRVGASAMALVGDLGTGSDLLRKISEEEWAAFAERYGLEPASRQEVLEGQLAGRSGNLEVYLDHVSTHLTTEGLEVRRVPLLLVPGSASSELAASAGFLVTWVNVVLERTEGRSRAEGFASGLPTGDTMAEAAFGRGGYELVLFPPLVASVLGNGGYRCASNHLRASSVAATGLLHQLPQGGAGVDHP